MIVTNPKYVGPSYYTPKIEGSRVVGVKFHRGYSKGAKKPMPFAALAQFLPFVAGL